MSSDPCESGTYRVSGEERIRVEEAASESDRFSDMLRIRKSRKRKTGSLTGSETVETWGEQTFANIPAEDGYAVMHALADYYECEVRSR